MRKILGFVLLTIIVTSSLFAGSWREKWATAKEKYWEKQLPREEKSLEKHQKRSEHYKKGYGKSDPEVNKLADDWIIKRTEYVEYCRKMLSAIKKKEGEKWYDKVYSMERVRNIKYNTMNQIYYKLVGKMDTIRWTRYLKHYKKKPKLLSMIKKIIANRKTIADERDKYCKAGIGLYKADLAYEELQKNYNIERKKK